MGRHGGGRRGADEGSGAEAGSARPGRSPQGAAPYSLTPSVEPVASADEDFDGKITLQEFLATTDRRFDELDTAGAGALALAGLPRTPVQQTRERRHHRSGDDD